MTFEKLFHSVPISFELVVQLAIIGINVVCCVGRVEIEIEI